MGPAHRVIGACARCSFPRSIPRPAWRAFTFLSSARALQLKFVPREQAGTADDDHACACRRSFGSGGHASSHQGKGLIGSSLSALCLQLVHGCRSPMAQLSCWIPVQLNSTSGWQFACTAAQLLFPDAHTCLLPGGFGTECAEILFLVWKGISAARQRFGRVTTLLHVTSSAALSHCLCFHAHSQTY